MVRDWLSLQEDVMPIQFDPSIPALSPWRPRLTAAYYFLPGLAQTCVDNLTPGQINWPLYHRWFDPGGMGSPARVAFVRLVFTSLRQWVDSKTLTFFDCTANAIGVAMPGVAAYVWQLGPGAGVAHVGSGVRIGMANGLVHPAWTNNDVAGLIAHELTHKIGLQHGYNIIDVAPAYGRDNCLAKAAGPNPQNAVTNADNYRCYLKEANGLAWVNIGGVFY
jgi:hypothetical protein